MNKYFKLTYNERNLECIFRLNKKFQSLEIPNEIVGDIEYSVELLLTKKNDNFIKTKRYYSILELKSSFCSETKTLKFTPNHGRIFEISNYSNLNFKNLGLFTYFSSLILHESLEYTKNDYLVKLPASRLCDKFEKQNPDNYKIRNSAYKKLGFRINLKEDGINGFLMDTPIGEIIQNTLDKPSCIEYYKDCMQLIEETMDFIPFKNEQVKFLNKYYLREFTVKETTETNASFDVSKIIGTDHPKYYRKTWREVFLCLRGVLTNASDVSLDENEDKSIAYYTNKANRDMYITKEWRIKVVNNEGYILEGNNRTTVAKFLNALGLIQKDMFGIPYVIHSEVDFASQRKFISIQRWLKRHYSFFEIKIEPIIKEQSSETCGNKTTVMNKIIYRRILNERHYFKNDKSGTEMGAIYFDNLQELENYLKSVVRYNQDFSFRYQSFLKVARRLFITSLYSKSKW